jgi:hypothetical protein
MGNSIHLFENADLVGRSPPQRIFKVATQTEALLKVATQALCRRRGVARSGGAGFSSGDCVRCTVLPGTHHSRTDLPLIFLALWLLPAQHHHRQMRRRTGANPRVSARIPPRSFTRSWNCIAARTASTVRFSKFCQEPVAGIFFAIRPPCCAIDGSTASIRSMVKRACVASSSLCIRRE